MGEVPLAIRRRLRDRLQRGALNEAARLRLELLIVGGELREGPSRSSG